jgi:hypothetical protein
MYDFTDAEKELLLDALGIAIDVSEWVGTDQTQRAFMDLYQKLGELFLGDTTTDDHPKFIEADDEGNYYRTWNRDEGN